jgi:hypothetical protein
MLGPNFLVCALADGPLMVVVGTSFQHVCETCQRRVMVSPSGQKRLKSLENCKIVCMDCFNENPPQADYEHQFSAGSLEAAVQELSRAVPNSWKNRN